jgi:hypothetical protein
LWRFVSFVQLCATAVVAVTSSCRPSTLLRATLSLPKGRRPVVERAEGAPAEGGVITIAA